MTNSNRGSVYVNNRSRLIVCWLLVYNLTLLVKNNWLVIWHNNELKGGTKIEIHNKGLLGESKIEHFYLDIGIIICKSHFSIVPVGTLGVNISS